MPEVRLSFATSAAVGTNGMAGNRLQSSQVPRAIKKIGVAGSAAAGDTSVDLFVETTFIGTYFNTSAGVVEPLEAKDFKTVDIGVAPGENINVILNTAPTSNALKVTLILEDNVPMA